jgi:hypothetical protein
MTTPRRRIIRRSVVASLHGSGRQLSDRLPVLHARLERERKAFDRWLSRLKRACHALETAAEDCPARTPDCRNRPFVIVAI